jgi:hypothetical protein
MIDGDKCGAMGGIICRGYPSTLKKTSRHSALWRQICSLPHCESPIGTTYNTHGTVSVVQWSEFLATDLKARVRFPALPEKKVVGLERSPFSLVSTTEELRDRKLAVPAYKTENTAVGTRHADHVTPSIRKSW